MRIKLLKPFLFAIIIFCAGYAYGLTQIIPHIEQAQAQTLWGGCSGAYAQCPGISGPISSCVQSADFDVTINSTGAPIPAGQHIIVTIEPADGSGSSCSGVTCLKRVINFQTKTNPTTSGGWPAGQTSWQMPTLNQIGCDTTGVCTNNYRVSVVFDQPFIDPNLNCPVSQIIPWTGTIQNGVKKTVPLSITCIAPAPTCPVVPTVVPTITCPNCQ